MSEEVAAVTIACGLNERDGDALALSLGGPVSFVPDVGTVLRSLRTARDETLVVVGPEVPNPQVLRFAAQVRLARPETVVVLLRPTVNRLDRELAHRAGIDAILPAVDIAAVGRSC